MIKKSLILFSLILLTSCSQRDPEKQLNFISGYWEIESVEVSEDSVKEYKVNPVVDYIEIKDSKGFRKKVKPRLDGTYTTSESTEEIEARIEDDSLRLYYTTPYDSWKETVISAGKDEMSIINRDGMIYRYKKFSPITIAKDEKKE
ncbi:lipocalin family protein [Salegentibacter chungangensis]|uniref:Lipocalin family protein n=1 Tax=Salegentibacter chungangensis TaxID=1335724 RepID=A0ABW3NT02_9FLAO